MTKKLKCRAFVKFGKKWEKQDGFTCKDINKIRNLARESGKKVKIEFN